jgi:endogenous inhibitor of DNA gyrase (YacG/DUF329 family)
MMATRMLPQAGYYRGTSGLAWAGIVFTLTTMDPASAPCPVCRAEVAISDPLPQAFPFCSSRCRVIDAGRWADEAYVIPAPLGIDDLDDLDWTGEAGGAMFDGHNSRTDGVW